MQPKPGYQTTEFWLTVAASLAATIGAGAGGIPPQWAAVATGISVGLYSISRGLAKQQQ